MSTTKHLRAAHAALMDAGSNLDTVANQHEATLEGTEAAELREDVLRAVARLEGLYGRLSLRCLETETPRQPRKPKAQPPAEEQDDASKEQDDASADGLCPTEGCGRPARRGGKPCNRCYQREWARRKAGA